MTGQVTDHADPNLDEDLDQDLDAELDTQTDPQPAPPAGDESGHGEDEQSPTPAPANGQPEATNIAEQRATGKLKQTQTELLKAQKELERLKNIEQASLKSPENYKWMLKNINGLDDAEADRYVEVLKSRGQWQTAQTPQGVAPQQNIEAIADQIVERKIQEKEFARTIQSEFFARVPELDPKKIPDAKKPSMRALATAIEMEAGRRLSEDPSLDLVSTLVDVYKDYTGKTDDQLNAAKEEGRLEGHLESTAAKAQTAKPAKGYSPKDNTFGLSSAELQQAKDEGLTPEEFAKLRDPVSIVG